MPPEAPDDFGELIRAEAYASLRTLAEHERARWSERREALSRRLGVEGLVPRDRVSALVWRLTLASLGQLGSAFHDAPGWLKSRYGDEEHRLLTAYADAHVAVLAAAHRSAR